MQTFFLVEAEPHENRDNVPWKEPTMRNWIAVILISAMGTTLLGDKAKVSPDSRDSFTFEGKPIHPGVISEFDVWISDADPPRVKTVDLESCQTSNKNRAAPQESPKGYLTCKSDDGWFGYSSFRARPYQAR
jgi:hypothetical protein